jgi:hypothetical protein
MTHAMLLYISSMIWKWPTAETNTRHNLNPNDARDVVRKSNTAITSRPRRWSENDIVLTLTRDITQTLMIHGMWSETLSWKWDLLLTLKKKYPKPWCGPKPRVMKHRIHVVLTLSYQKLFIGHFITCNGFYLHYSLWTNEWCICEMSSPKQLRFRVKKTADFRYC